MANTKHKKQSSKNSKPMSWKEFTLTIFIVIIIFLLLVIGMITSTLKVEPTPIACPPGSSTMVTYSQGITFVQICTDLKDVESIINTAYNLSEASQ